MTDQLKAIPRVLYRPRSTLKNLPSDKLYLLAFITPLYFGYARGVRTGTLAKITEMTGNRLLAYTIFLLLGLIFILLGALVVRVVIRLFGKRLTLWGYTPDSSYPYMLWSAFSAAGEIFDR